MKELIIQRILGEHFQKICLAVFCLQQWKARVLEHNSVRTVENDLIFLRPDMHRHTLCDPVFLRRCSRFRRSCFHGFRKLGVTLFWNRFGSLCPEASLVQIFRIRLFFGIAQIPVRGNQLAYAFFHLWPPQQDGAFVP